MMKNVMYVCMYVKMDILLRSDMQWNMDNEDLDERRLERGRDISIEAGR